MRDILVIEDGLHERERLVSLLRAQGYSVSAAESAAEAEYLLRMEQFRLAILDIGLSDKSGSHVFERMRQHYHVPFVIVFTGNPSIHLKQRFLEKGAYAYIVKASADARNESLLSTITSALGSNTSVSISGMPLEDFLRLYLTPESKSLFLDSDYSVVSCRQCGSTEYVVTFGHKVQLPPIVEGKVVCVKCGAQLDPEVG